MNTPTCATCKYILSESRKNLICELKRECGHYHYIEGYDRACPSYKPQASTQKDTPKQP